MANLNMYVHVYVPQTAMLYKHTIRTQTSWVTALHRDCNCFGVEPLLLPGVDVVTILSLRLHTCSVFFIRPTSSNNSSFVFCNSFNVTRRMGVAFSRLFAAFASTSIRDFTCQVTLLHALYCSCWHHPFRWRNLSATSGLRQEGC